MAKISIFDGFEQFYNEREFNRQNITTVHIIKELPNYVICYFSKDDEFYARTGDKKLAIKIARTIRNHLKVKSKSKESK